MKKKIKLKKRLDAIEYSESGTLSEIQEMFPSAFIDPEKGLCIGDLEGCNLTTHYVAKDNFGNPTMMQKEIIDTEYELDV